MCTAIVVTFYPRDIARGWR